MEPDVQALLDELDRAEREVEEFVGGLNESEFNRPPEGRKGWSVAQILEHVSTTNDQYITAVAGALAAAKARGGYERRGPIRLPWFGRWFVGQLEPPPKRRFRAVAKTQPPSEASKLEVLLHFRAAQVNVRGFLRQFADLDLNRIRFPNPFIPGLRFTCGTAFHILNAHTRRHLWQARRVLAGFTPAGS
jgi:hypothetical protein